MEIPELTRRALLRTGVRAAGLVAASPLLATGCSRDARPGLRTGGLAVLSPRELEILDAAADTFVPEGGAFAVGARSVDLARRIDAALAPEDPAVVQGVRGALTLLEWAAPLATGHLGRFTGLGGEDRAAVLRGLARHRLDTARAVYTGLRQLCLFHFYCADESWPATGYDGPWVGRAVPGVPPAGRAAPGAAEPT